MFHISIGRLRLTGKSLFIRTRVNAFTYKKHKSQKAVSPNLDNCGHLIIAVIPSQSELYNSRNIFSLAIFWLQVGREKLLFYKSQNTHIQILRAKFKIPPRLYIFIDYLLIFPIFFSKTVIFSPRSSRIANSVARLVYITWPILPDFPIYIYFSLCPILKWWDDLERSVVVLFGCVGGWAISFS